MTTLWLFLVPMLCLISILLRLRRKPYPPGPTGLPIIGNMMMMDQLTHRGLAKLARNYGGLFHLKMDLVHMIVVSSPEEAREVLQLQDSIFSNRPASIAISYLTYNRADYVFSNYGPFWRKMRKLCVVHLFSRKRAESWQSVRDEVGNILRAVSGRASSPINIGELVFKLATNITYRAAFGSKVFKQQDEFLTILQEFSKLFGAFNIADYIPFLKWLDPSRLNGRLTKARCALDGFVDQIIDDHMNNKKDVGDETGNNAKGDKVEEDMVDDLLNFYCEKPKITESGVLQNAIKLTRDNIKGIIMVSNDIKEKLFYTKLPWYSIKISI